MKKFILNFSLFFLCLFVNAQPAFIKDSLDIFVEREMTKWQVPGLAIAIVKDGKVVLSKGYGVKRAGTTEKVNEFTLFQIASNSKAFTGTAIAILDYQKRLSLDEKVTKYLPWFKLYEPTSTELCTVRDLLCHRIGLQTFQGDFLNWGSNLTRREIMEHLAVTPPTHAFRYKYGYCNAGFITAGEIIPAVTDTSWDDYLKYNFFNKLNMVHTNTSFSAMLNDKNACTPHTLLKNKITLLPLANIENMGPSASINSCVADMANWLILQLNDGRFNNQQIIPKEVINETRKSNMVVRDYNSSFFKTKHFATYTLGWQMYDYEGRRVIEHSGGANGFVTKTEFIPEENLGVIVYTNSDANSLYDAMCKQIIESYLNMPYRNISELYFNNSAKGKAFEDKELADLKSIVAQKNKLTIDLKEFTGNYTNSVYGKVEIKNVKGKLQLFFEHHPNNIGTLEHLTDNQFLCTYSDITCGVEKLGVKIENNRVKSITVKVNDFIDYLSYEFVKE